MLWCNIPGFYDSDKGGPRWGSCHIFMDGKNVFVVDGYCTVGADRLINRLLSWDKLKLYLAITHPHYDHYNGIERIIDDSRFTVICLYVPDPSTYNRNFSSECRQNVEALERIINKAKLKGIKVSYLYNNDLVSIGDIKFVTYRNQPTTAENTDSYLNDGSLCFWFYELKYLTTGDAGFECVRQHGLKPAFIMGGHHGNTLDGGDLKPSKMARFMYDNGCKYYWDNDYSTNYTDFLMTGREDAVNSGMKFINIHGDINFISYDNKVVIYKGAEHWSYRCSYNKPLTLKAADIAILKVVLKGKLGNGDARISELIRLGYAPYSVQANINDFYKLIKG